VRGPSSSHRARLILLGPAIAVGLLVLVLERWTAYTSDSVAQQSLVRTWLDAGHGTAYVPVDTWILKLPLYVLVELLPIAPGARLSIDVLALSVAGFVLLAPAAWWLARALRPGAAPPHPLDVAAPLLWLATLGGELGANRMQPNYRNVELGLTFLALAVAARRLDVSRIPRDAPGPSGPGGAPAPQRTLAGAAAGIVGLTLLWVDDPYFAMLVGAPFVVACLACWPPWGCGWSPAAPAPTWAPRRSCAGSACSGPASPPSSAWPTPTRPASSRARAPGSPARPRCSPGCWPSSR
jgi:hypothetical protein